MMKLKKIGAVATALVFGLIVVAGFMSSRNDPMTIAFSAIMVAAALGVLNKQFPNMFLFAASIAMGIVGFVAWLAYANYYAFITMGLGGALLMLLLFTMAIMALIGVVPWYFVLPITFVSGLVGAIITAYTNLPIYFSCFIVGATLLAGTYIALRRINKPKTKVQKRKKGDRKHF